MRKLSLPKLGLRFLPVVALVAMTALVATGAHADARPNAEPVDIDVDLLAKIAKERAKTNAQRAADRKNSLVDERTEDGCGNIGIGNVFSGGRPGFQPPREITVIVTGDVISANNNCR